MHVADHISQFKFDGVLKDVEQDEVYEARLDLQI